MMAAVTITRGLWRGFDVQVEPPRIGHPQRSFKDREAANAFAGELARERGWRIVDRVGDD